ncbi:unnamed protein product [Pleuronectes platessa]|uniref:Large ribosomal subunit protein uL4 C-terminal domain-containing protein n=1 Tax=Pleuronectes platessa TaxID=8262 RepID=A0A9N7VXA4_PLEPL|nr:unnamed protein product [Pleuronectes platessa]
MFMKSSSIRLTGITLQNVNKLNLLRLPPGGHVGHFCIWTESAFLNLDELYGTWRKPASLKTLLQQEDQPARIMLELNPYAKTARRNAILKHDPSNMNKLNLLRLAPGGHVGRFCIWTESAFLNLDELLPMHKMTNTDLSRILKSEEIQKALCAPNKKINRRFLKSEEIQKALCASNKKINLQSSEEVLKSEEIQKALCASNKNINLKSEEIQKALCAPNKKINRKVLKNPLKTKMLKPDIEAKRNMKHKG